MGDEAAQREMNAFAFYGRAVIVNEGPGKDGVKAIIAQAFLHNALRYVDAFYMPYLPPFVQGKFLEP
jgi:hypothetical protein